MARTPSNQIVILDHEAIHALSDVGHAKHRLVIALMQMTAHRRGKGRNVHVLIPAAVRVESGWDCSRPSAAIIDRLRIIDVALDSDSANRAANITAANITAVNIGAERKVSVADAHIGATISVLRAHSISTRISVVTSDPSDIAVVAGDHPVTMVAI
jgi:hypothetical protein